MHYAGPFEKPPFDNFIQSPIGLVPKDGDRDVRLIFHLSYLRTGRSVNSDTPDKLCTVKYPDFLVTIHRCMEHVAKHGSCYISKTDAKSAFRILGINRQSWPWLLMAARHPSVNVGSGFLTKHYLSVVRFRVVIFRGFQTVWHF